MKIAQRFRSLDLLTRWTLACIVLAVALRLLLIAFQWPYTDSDEGNMGLLTLHVAFTGEHPIFFYGGNYLGPLEGYAAVPFFWLFGSSLFALRLPLVLFFAIFLLAMYLLVRLLYQDRRFALLSVLLLGAGSPDVLFLQLRASGEYPEIEMCAALICLLALWLALSSPRSAGRQCWRRHLCYGLFGLLVGVAIWVDLLVAPFVLAAGLLLAFFCWRELLHWFWCSLLAGWLVGAFPLIFYNLTAPWSQNSLLVFLHLRDSAAALMTTWHLNWLHQMSGTFFVALPMATGGAWSCSLSPLSLSAAPLPVAVPCLLVQGGWSAGYLSLLCLVTIPTVRLLWWRSRRQPAHGPEHADRVRVAGRLVIPASAALTLLLYVLSPVSASVPDTSFRYLTCLLLALPALLWPLWQGWQIHTRALKKYSQGVLLVLVVAILIAGLGRTLLQMPASQARYQVQQELVQDLQQIDATRLYSDYWTCNILIFLSREKIICSALGDDLSPAQDRYPPYRQIVHTSPHPGYIFVAGSPPDVLMQQRLRANPVHYRVSSLFEYHVYQQI